MSEQVSKAQQFKIQLATVFWTVLVLFGAAGLAIIHVLPWWMIAIVVAIGVLIGTLVYLFGRLIRRGQAGVSMRKTLLAHAAGGVLVATGVAALPIYYMAYFVTSGTTALPLATLSNGKKTVVFQGMQHVASPDFYKSVVYDLEKALIDGFTLFYEGVQPVAGRPDLTEWFNQTLRGTKKDLSSGYNLLADGCGLAFQLTYFEPLLSDTKLHPSKHVTADVSYLDMKNEYDRLIREDPAFAQAISERTAKKPDDDGSTLAILSAASKASSDQKRLIGILCRGVMGLSIAGVIGDKDAVMERIILDFRNRALARFVAQSSQEKIYITYGAAHFPGFLKELQTLDPDFSVAALRWVRPMAIDDEPAASSSQRASQ